LGLRLGGALWRFWWIRGYLTEGRDRLAQLLARASEPTPARAKVLLGAGVLAHEQGDYTLAQACYEECLAIRQQGSDPAEVSDPGAIAEPLNLLGTLARARGDSTEAGRLYEESLSLVGARDAGLRAKVLHNLAILAADRGDVDEQWRLNQEALRYRRMAGDARGEAETLGNLGALAQLRGNLAEARDLYRDSLTLRRRLGDRQGIAVILNNLAELAELEGDLPAAVALFDHAERLFRDLGSVHPGYTAAALQRIADSVGPDRWEELRAAADRTGLGEMIERGEGLSGKPPD
jgi:tetratricopeptide (TPR) repeat protein